MSFVRKQCIDVTSAYFMGWVTAPRIDLGTFSFLFAITSPIAKTMCRR